MDGQRLPMVIGASDRMLTSGDSIEFEPETPKIIQLTRSAVVMTAGDMSVHAEILAALQPQVLRWLATKTPVSVGEVADAYLREYLALRLRRAERAYLAPLGLSADTYLDGRVAPVHVDDLKQKMQDFDLGIAAIVSGVDSHGSHILVVQEGNVYCDDRTTFAAIGTGSWHARSYLSYLRHAGTRLYPDALFHCFSAKYRAQAAAGVGQATDMFLAGPVPGVFMTIPPEMVKGLEAMHRGLDSGLENGIDVGLKPFREALLPSIQDTVRTALKNARKTADKPVTEE